MKKQKKIKSIEDIKREIIETAKRQSEKRRKHTIKKHNKSVRRVLRPLSYKINSPEQAQKMAKALDDFLKRNG